MIPIWFVLLLPIFGSSCRTTDDVSSTLKEAPVEASYAVFGKNEMSAAKSSLEESLQAFLKNPEASRADLERATQNWIEVQSFFLHLFKFEEGEDLYFTLLSEAQYGRFLMDQANEQDRVMTWAEASLKRLKSEDIQNYLGRCNTDFASRRRNDLVPRSYWFGVNFIPALNASFASNLKDYWKAQKKAFRDDVAHADRGDPLFPEQEIALGHVVDRSTTLLSLKERFHALDDDADFRSELLRARDFYSQILEEVKRYEDLKRKKEDAKASVLGRKIRIDWVNEMAQKQTTLAPKLQQ